MSREVFKLLTLFISTFTFLINCESSTEPIAKGVIINREIVADCLGDHNGNTTKTELDSLNHYFLNNKQAWAVGSGLTRFGNKIPSDSLQKYFMIYGPLFVNENE